VIKTLGMESDAIAESRSPNEVHVWRVALDPVERRAGAREALGDVLAGYLDGKPPALHREPGGKPRLAEDPERLSFNLSHSRELALIAVSTEGVELGVDVEWIRERRDLPRLAARWLGFHDALAVAAAPPGRREPVFYDAWTRHEARVKCTGTGLAGPPPGPEVRAWQLEVADGYAAALALVGDEEPRIVLKDASDRG
jgi:4'-phosphopantetheinyl transferase